MTIRVQASDGSSHRYPDGFKCELQKDYPDWLFIKDETGQYLAQFFRPVYWLHQS